jgi:hypothetical protein
MKNTIKSFCLIAAVCHFIVFFVIAIHIYFSSDGQASMLWIIFAIIDFPVSLFYLLAGPKYSQLLHSLDGNMLAQLMYLPYFIHGFLGTVWWYFVPKILKAILRSL